MGDLGRAPEKASISLMVGAAYPRADEQDAERAMRVGLALVEVVAALDTGAPRTSEILGIQWQYIDEANQLLVIPRNRMKVKTGDDHVIPLTARPMAIIEEMKAVRRNDYLFPGHGHLKRPEDHAWTRPIGHDPNAEGAPLSHPALWDFVKNELGYHDITTHGFRRTFKNWATQHRFRDIVVEFCLDHKYGTAIENVYRDTRLLDERRELLQAWSDSVPQSLSGFAYHQARRAFRCTCDDRLRPRSGLRLGGQSSNNSRSAR